MEMEMSSKRTLAVNGHEQYCRGDGNVLKLIYVMAAQLSKFNFKKSSGCVLSIGELHDLSNMSQ